MLSQSLTTFVTLGRKHTGFLPASLFSLCAATEGSFESSFRSVFKCGGGGATLHTTSPGTWQEWGEVYAVGPVETHKANVIILHGIGDRGYEWAHCAKYMGQNLPQVKFVMPTGRLRPATGYGRPMTSWFDIALRVDDNEDEVGFRDSASYIASIILKEANSGVALENTVVMGYGQGAALALLMLRGNIKLAGIIGISSYVPMKERLPLVSKENSTTPVLLLHGIDDKTTSLADIQEGVQILKDNNVCVDLRKFHNQKDELTPLQIDDAVEFIKAVVPPPERPLVEAGPNVKAITDGTGKESEGGKHE